MHTIPPDDPFIATWHLDPAHNDYQTGPLPSHGTYTIGADGARYTFDIHWRGPDGRPQHISFALIPDGQRHPYADHPVVTHTVCTRVDNRTLDSDSYAGAVLLAHARRVLSADGQTMTVTQRIHPPNADPYTNTSLDRRSA